LKNGRPTVGTNTYEAVLIGEQVWMAENLNHNTNNASTSRCYGDDSGGDSKGNCVKYGRLYTHATALTLCPSGWHLPKEEEYQVLALFINPSCAPTGYCDNVGTILKATSGWNASSGNGTDDYGFRALPGGQRCGQGYTFGDGVYFREAGEVGYWWSGRSAISGIASYWSISFTGRSANVNSSANSVFFHSVRCVKD